MNGTWPMLIKINLSCSRTLNIKKNIMIKTFPPGIAVSFNFSGAQYNPGPWVLQSQSKFWFCHTKFNHELLMLVLQLFHSIYLNKIHQIFVQVNDYKFNQVWRMSALKCSELSRELRHAEVAMHAHVLAEPPPPRSAQIPKSPLQTQLGNLLIIYF